MNPEKRELGENPEIVDGFPSDYIRPKITNESTWEAIVKDVLGNKKVSELRNNNEWIKAIFFFKPTGEVLSISFSVKEGTKLNLTEIAKIEKALKTRYKAAFESEKNRHVHLSQIMLTLEIYF